MEIVDLVWAFPADVLHPLPQHPWAGQTLHQACGRNDDLGPVGRTGRTPVIPRSVQRALFLYCETRLDEAEALFQARDAGEIAAYSYELTALRDAILFLLQITSGMRNVETTGVVNQCWRTEKRRGADLHWVRTKEIKTKRGWVDFLVPPEALRALEILQRYAGPLQARLADEGRWLEAQLRHGIGDELGRLGNGMTIAEANQRLNHVREIGRHLFLALTKKCGSDHLGKGSRVDVMSVGACNAQLKTLARAAGVEWGVANHQCRRTFAYNVANSRLGCMGLVFLKWQLKHTSLSWTQLYAANPYQDHALYGEMEKERTRARVELLEGWLRPDHLLGGGAGKKLMQTRATPVKDLQSLLRHTAETVDIRSTGHAWCLSGAQGCHGQGVYEPTMCGGCSQAIIDHEQAGAWQMIHLENLRLAAITDCGPTVAMKAERAVLRSRQVLQDLGVPLPTKEQADAYEREGRHP
ncbi:integrase [Variovorax boronicumulans]|uniref:integrase n=1 Tax=Variovorax boronicumulans TaxID=436515 RepID=UPI001F0AA781|nr:integrase [Variovorax boronicumulans]